MCLILLLSILFLKTLLSLTMEHTVQLEQLYSQLLGPHLCFSKLWLHGTLLHLGLHGFRGAKGGSQTCSKDYIHSATSLARYYKKITNVIPCQ